MGGWLLAVILYIYVVFTFLMCAYIILVNEYLKVNLYYAFVKNAQYHISYFPKLIWIQMDELYIKGNCKNFTSG